MSRKRKHRALFDDLWEIVKRDGHRWNCCALSDLRYNGYLLRHSLRRLRGRRYPPGDWLELARYLARRPQEKTGRGPGPLPTVRAGSTAETGGEIMSTVMTAQNFIAKAKNIAQNYKTLYIMGCFGAPMTLANKKRYCSNNKYNMNSTRRKMIMDASADTFGFDCVCLIKGILWGWNGDTSKTYGGAVYASNGVPDIGADKMIKVCSGVSTTGWDEMAPGEVVWMKGHIGIYIGNGLVVECSPKWENKVQITAVGNGGKKSGLNTRTWTKHGKLPWIDYEGEKSTSFQSLLCALRRLRLALKAKLHKLLDKLFHPC